MPLMMLNSVVLPEPFGPITAWIVPCATESETPSSAVRPPKRLVTPVSSSSAFMMRHIRSSKGFLAPAQAARDGEDHPGKPCGKEGDHEDHHHAEHGEVIFLHEAQQL